MVRISWDISMSDDKKLTLYIVGIYIIHLSKDIAYFSFDVKKIISFQSSRIEKLGGGYEE